jgi:hypothetical protein
VDYDARYGTVYGSPADAALPYSASMAITGSGGSLQFYNNANGVLWFNRVPGTNLTVIGIQGYDDYANADWMGYEIAYLQQGSLPSEAPPQGAITASKAQVLTKGSVIISWTLN